MTLRTDYTDAFDVVMNAARQAGNDFILVTSLAAIQAELGTNSASGNKTFTITLTPSYDPVDLKLLGPKWLAFKSGIEEALYSEDIISSEVSVVENCSDVSTFRVDLNFTF
jgi:hypothetical protein